MLKYLLTLLPFLKKQQQQNKVKIKLYFLLWQVKFYGCL